MDDDDDDDRQTQLDAQSRQPAIRYEEVFAIAGAKPGALPQGDKMLLPPSALEALLAAAARARQQAGGGGGGGGSGRDNDGYDLPQPLTFRLTSAATGRTAYAGIREFSAAAGEAVLSAYLRDALGVGDGPSSLSVAFCPLPKGTFVRLRPLAAGYSPGDWRPLLERQLREGYTTLTRGAVFTVRGGHGTGDAFRFRVDDVQPAGDGICVVDTDLEVDIEAIEALDEAQAGSGGDGSDNSSNSVARPIDIWKPVSGRVRAGDYVDYELTSWDRSRPLALVLSDFDDDGEDPGLAVDLLASPHSTRHRARPRETEHVWAHFGIADAGADGAKTITLQPSPELEAAEALWIAVHGWQDPDAAPSAKAHRYTLRAKTVLEDDGVARPAAAHGPDEEQCKHCGQWVSRTMVFHEAFCLRHNAACPTCRQVFHKRSAAWADHWHCALDPDDGGRGSTAASRAKHDRLFHAGRGGAGGLFACPAETCAGVVAPFASLPALARHRTTSCPAKLILCQFCQLEVPQEGDPADPAVDAATVLTGQTPHERADGARTTDCYLCGAIVRLRDMRAHLQHHDLDRQRRAAPEICRDALCGRTRFGVGPRGQVRTAPAGAPDAAHDGRLGLCSTCFAPLYVATHDPERKALRRRVERRYLAQLLTGCGKPWCDNAQWCKTARARQGLGPFAAPDGTPAVGSGALLPLVKPLVADAMAAPDRALHFCVDEESHKRRAVAVTLALQSGGVYTLAWCIAACEAEGADAAKAWEWLRNWAPRRRPS